MLKLIIAWQKNKDYQLGVEIYLQFGKSAYYKELFQKYETTFNKNLLEKELQNLLDEYTTPKIQTQETHKKIQESRSTARPSDAENAPEEIKKAIKRRKYLYAVAKSNHGKLLELFWAKSEDINLHNKLNHETLDAWDEIKSLWDLTNFYDANLRLPNKIKTDLVLESIDSEILNKTYENNYKYIHKYGKDAAKIEKIKLRIQETHAIKAILLKRQALYKESFHVPTIEEYLASLSTKQP